MECLENNKTLILQVEAVRSDGIDLTKYNAAENEAPLVIGTSFAVKSGAERFRLIAEESSFSLGSSQFIERGGTKYKVSLGYTMMLPVEDGADEMTQLHKLENNSYSLIITYFGGAQSFVYCSDGCMLFQHEQKDGKYSCEIFIQNLTDIQQIKP